MKAWDEMRNTTTRPSDLGIQENSNEGSDDMKAVDLYPSLSFYSPTVESTCIFEESREM